MAKDSIYNKKSIAVVASKKKSTIYLGNADKLAATGRVINVVIPINQKCQENIKK